MNTPNTNAWIFLALAYASQAAPADVKSISGMADGINHDIPTEQEMQLAFEWLLSKKLILKKGEKYALSKAGERIVLAAQEKTSVVMKIWKNITLKFSTLS